MNRHNKIGVATWVLLLLLIAAFWPVPGRAQTSTPNHVQYRDCKTETSDFAPCNVWVDSAAAACDNFASWKNGINAPNGGPFYKTDRVDPWRSTRYCYWSWPAYTDKNGTRQSGGTLSDYLWMRCAPDTTKGVKTSAATEAEACPATVSNEPPPPPKCAVGTQSTVRMNYGVVGADFGKTAPLPVSWNGCEVKATSVIECYQYVANKQTECRYVVENTGVDGLPTGPNVSADTGSAPSGTTSSNSPPIKADNALNCPRGTVQAGIDKDGVPLCVGTGTNPGAGQNKESTSVEKPPVTTTNEDGSTSTVKESVKTNADGSTTTTTTTTTTAADGTVTVSQKQSTSATPTGDSGKADKADTDNICKSNPDLSICRNSSVAGSCDSGYTCTGDAVQCATMQAARALECKQKKDADQIDQSSEKNLGAAVAGGNDPAKSSLPSVSSASVVQAPSSLDTSGFLGGGSYFKDKTITVQGRTITIPLSKGEDIMITFRYVLMAIAALVSFKIIRGAVLT